MQPCGLATFHPTQLGLMGTFRYTFAVIGSICLWFFYLFIFFALVLLFVLPVYYCSEVAKNLTIVLVKNIYRICIMDLDMTFILLRSLCIKHLAHITCTVHPGLVSCSFYAIPISPF